jgi:glycosyltransferase involved in cell wall biosynthesis
MLGDELARRDSGTLAFAFPDGAQESTWFQSLQEAGYEVQTLPSAPPVLGSRTSVSAVKSIVRSVDPDIVHSHFGTYDVSVVRATGHVVRSHRRRKPLVLWHYRTALEEELGERSAGRVAKDWLRYRVLGKGVTNSIAVTEALAVEARERGMGDRSIAVVAGCDTDTFRADPERRRTVRAELGVGADEIMLLHLGWAWHRKGGDLLALACKELMKEGHRVRAFSVGASDADIEAPITRLDPTDEIARYHQASDIFVSASRSEGFGNGLVEAMSCERVAVAAAASGQIETFDGVEGVETFAPGDAHGLAEGLQRLIARREEWQAAGQANRMRIVERHSMRRWATELVDHYVSILDRVEDSH